MKPLPPPPAPSLSKLRQSYRFIREPFSFLSEVREECGDLFELHLPGAGKILFLCSADLLNQVYKKSEEEVVAGEIRKKIVGYLTGSEASLSIDGKAYAERRRIMAPALSPRSIHGHAAAIRRFAEEAIAGWPRQGSFRLMPYFDRISLRTICLVLFGPREDKPDSRLVALCGRFLAAFRSKAVHTPFLHWDLGPASPWGRFLRIRRQLRRELDREIRSRAASEPLASEELLSAFLAARIHEDEAKARDIIVQETLSMLVGGGETTSTVLGWTLAGLLRNRPALERLREEIRTVLGERPIEAADLKDMPYLDAVYQEGTRYQSVGPFAGPRLAKKDIVVGGYLIPAGSVMVQCLSEVGRSSVFPHPDRFDPENFFSSGVKPKDWVPFGGGSRVCTGMALARVELPVVIATIVRAVDLELGPGSVEPVRKGMVFQPKNSLRVRRVS